MAKKKAFNELTEQGKKQRLAKYAKERAERGTTDHLVRLVRDPKIKVLDNGAKQASFRFVEYNKETKEKEYFNATAYIAEGKDALLAYYESTGKGDLVSLEIKEVEAPDGNTYKNIYNMLTREKAKANLAPAEEPALEA